MILKKKKYKKVKKAHFLLQAYSAKFPYSKKFYFFQVINFSSTYFFLILIELT